jgi:transposase InsO family protein
LDVPRAWLYRQLQEATGSVVGEARPSPARALDAGERSAVLELLHSERFVDRSPSEMYATLLDEGTYRCSIRTMYRILEENREVRERRDQLRHPQYQKPELLATGANQVWSWDITKLLGPVKWTYFYLYVILDIYSRYVVGWMVAPRESAELAKRLIGETSGKQNIAPEQLTIHADRGTSMTSKPVALMLADLGITKTHSRPQVSNDNPYSESQFKTLKYRPEFPERFGSIEGDETLIVQIDGFVEASAAGIVINDFEVFADRTFAERALSVRRLAFPRYLQRDFSERRSLQMLPHAGIEGEYSQPPAGRFENIRAGSRIRDVLERVPDRVTVLLGRVELVHEPPRLQPGGQVRAYFARRLDNRVIVQSGGFGIVLQKRGARWAGPYWRGITPGFAAELALLEILANRVLSMACGALPQKELNFGGRE